MRDRLRFLLMQVRNPEDPMREQEVSCFSRVLRCDPAQITPWDLLRERGVEQAIAKHDMVFVGGSGEFSATSREAWIDPILDVFRELHRLSKPTFASCWGHQAMARALGGQVINDLDHAEVGTHTLKLTEAGRQDPLFSSLGDEFLGQMGHEDRVLELPADAVLLASTDRVENQAYRFADKPIYCTQFHPELNYQDLLCRVKQYPEYIHRIAKMPPERFSELLQDSPGTEQLLSRFVDQVFGS